MRWVIVIALVVVSCVVATPISELGDVQGALEPYTPDNQPEENPESVSKPTTAGIKDESPRVANDDGVENPMTESPVNIGTHEYEGATSVDQVKSSMKNSIQEAMAIKKADLVAKASASETVTADNDTENTAEKTAAAQTKAEIIQEQEAAEEQVTTERAKKQASEKKMERADQEEEEAKYALQNADQKNALLFQRQTAEEGAKAATANRIAAEEKAKTSAAQRVMEEENAKKAAAVQITKEEEARASQKTPMELHAMEAQAFEQAAALKVREGEALAKIAALKTGSDLQHTEDKDVANEANANSKLHEAKVALHHLVEQATAALFQAKAKPFDKAALEQVTQMREQVSQAKAKVLRLRQDVNVDQKDVTHDKQAAHEDDDDDDDHDDDDDRPGAAHEGNIDDTEHEKDPHFEKKYDLKHPDIRHMSDEQIHYWANKKMEWRNEDPMNTNKVMAKIFDIKNMEAQTLSKMNEVNAQMSMPTNGTRATMMGRGQTVIVGGELVSPNPSFHLNHVFQGQKGKDPQTENVGRDPERDALKVFTDQSLSDHLSQLHEHTTQEIDRAVAARKFPFLPPGSAQGSVSTLDDLKKLVGQNKKQDTQTEESSRSEQKAIDESIKGEEEEKPQRLGDDDSTFDAASESEDEDALTDDNDVSEIEDETSMMDDLGDIDDSRV